MNLLSNRVEIRDTYNAPTFGLDERNGIPLAVTADKKAEGKLQGLVTEKSVMIEPKFFNAAMAKNRLSICMAANSEGILPASGDERRYAAFNVDNKYAVGQATEEVRIAYFDALHTEMYKKGGIEAMMDDLLSMDLGDWCPRKEIPDTDALHEQKELSLKPLDKYWVHLLDSSYLPNNKYNAPHEATAAALLRDAVFNVPNGRHDFENGKLGRYLRAHGCIQDKNIKEIVPGRYEDEAKKASGWKFPILSEARAAQEPGRQNGHYKICWIKGPDLSFKHPPYVSLRQS